MGIVAGRISAEIPPAPWCLEGQLGEGAELGAAGRDAGNRGWRCRAECAPGRDRKAASRLYNQP